LRFWSVGDALTDIGSRIVGGLLHPGRDLFRHRPDQRNFFLGFFIFCRNFFWFFKFQPELFWNFQLSRQLFFLFSTFDRKIFRFFKFRAEKKPEKLMSPAGLS
jgi:hypothetical protein